MWAETGADGWGPPSVSVPAPSPVRLLGVMRDHPGHAQQAGEPPHLTTGS
jgi:hypothetical protein